MGNKAEVKQKAKKRFFTLKVKMLIVAIVPVVVAMAAAMIVGALSLKGKIADQEIQTLVKSGRQSDRYGAAKGYSPQG